MKLQLLAICFRREVHLFIKKKKNKHDIIFDKINIKNLIRILILPISNSVYCLNPYNFEPFYFVYN